MGSISMNLGRVSCRSKWQPRRAGAIIACGLALAGHAVAHTFAATTAVAINGQSPGRIFAGIGGESAGASTRLLVDYPKKQRAEILNFLFKPDFGAGFQNLKCELGGDMNSTDGTEPAYFRSRREYEHPRAADFKRGYETWLMRQARRRNPNIRLGLLQWGAPGWLGDRTAPPGDWNKKYYSRDNANYITRAIQGLNRFEHIRINYVGCWNERGWNIPWIMLLRRKLDAGGLRHVHIELADFFKWNLLTKDLAANAKFAHCVSAIGVHYPGYQSTPAARALHVPLWSGEDWSGAKPPAASMAKLINRNYIDGRMVRTIIWALDTSYYNNLPAADDGLLLANTPWSGYFRVPGALWAIAQTTQFAQPGWQYLNTACKMLKGHGSVVALKSQHGRNFSMIIETEDATDPQKISVIISGGLPTGRVLHVWRSLPRHYFIRQPNIMAADGRFTMTLPPHAIVSITTTSGQHKGTVAHMPPARAFPLPYKTALSQPDIAGMPRYFSPEEGAFTVIKDSGGGHVLQQTITGPQIPWAAQHAPFTILGSTAWHNYAVSCDVRLPKKGAAGILDRLGYVSWSLSQSNGYRVMLHASGRWQLLAVKKMLAQGRVAPPGRAWHRLKLVCRGGTISAYFDHKKLASVASGEYFSGMAGLATGWNIAWFKNFSIRPLPNAVPVNVALNKPAVASSQWSAAYAARFANDGKVNTRWNAANGTAAGQWLKVNLGGVFRVRRVAIRQFAGRIAQFKIQIKKGKQWRTVFAGSMANKKSVRVTFPKVKTREVRILILSTAGNISPSIREMAVFR